MLNVLFVYPGNELKVGGYSSDETKAFKQIVEELGQFPYVFKVNVASATPRKIAIDRGATKSEANSDYDLDNVFKKIDKIGAPNLDGLILMENWNDAHMMDTNSFGSRNNESRKEIMSKIREKYPELVDRLVYLSGILGDADMLNYGEGIIPLKRGGDVALIKHLSDLRKKRNIAKTHDNDSRNQSARDITSGKKSAKWSGQEPVDPKPNPLT